MDKITVSPAYERRFLIGVTIASTVFGIAGGLVPFGYGAIPGGVAGLIVGRIWVRIMLRRAQKEKSIMGPAIGWGGVMGLLATILLHATMGLFLYYRAAMNCHYDDDAVWIWPMSVVIGLPIGLVAGLLLGFICGGLLHCEVE